MAETESLIPHLNDLYRSKRSNDIPNAKNFTSWQKRKQKELKRVLGLSELSVTRVKKGEFLHLEEGDLRTEYLRMSDGTWMRVYVGTPPKTHNRPIIMYHGHANGAQTLFGLALTKDHQNYGLEFMRQGYVVIAPDLRGFGNRLGPSPIHFRGYTRSCRQLSLDLMMYGKTLLGERVADAIALVRHVKKLKRVDAAHIVITGNSGGGTVALLQAALDQKVDAAIIGSALSEYKNSIMEISHCECNYMPGVLNYFKDMAEIASLAAPKPLLVIHGVNDAIYPIAATKRAVRNLRRYYSLAPGVFRLPEISIHAGEHRYDHAGVFQFITSIRNRF